MNKLLTLAATCAFLIPNFTDARTHTIVEKDSYGTGLYSSAAINGNYVFASNANPGVDVLDLSDTSNVTLFGTIESPCTVYDVAIDGDILAAACTNDIHFYNVSDIANPVSVGFIDDFSGSVNDYVFVDKRLYLANDFSEIVVYEITDSDNIVELSRITLDTYNRIDLHKKGDFLYAVEGYDVARIYNVSDANSIQLVAEYVPSVSQIFDVEVVNNTMYLSYADGIQVIDISERNAPTFIKNMTPTPDSGEFGRSSRLHAEGDDLYLGTTTGEVVQFDLSDPHNPIDLTYYSIDDYLIGDLKLLDNTVLAFSNYGGLSMADFSDIDNILPLNGYNQSMFPQDIAIEDNRVVVTNNGPVFHLLELDEDFGLNEVNRIEGIKARGAASLNGDTAWLTSNSSIEIYDISNFEAPLNTGTVEVESNYGNKVTTYDGDSVYVGSYSGDVFVYDVSTQTPILVSTIELGTDPETNRDRRIEDIKPYGDYLLIATLYDDLVVIDMSDPSNPVELASYSWTGGNNAQIEVVGNTLYLTKSGGLFLADISDINNPAYLGLRGNYGILRTIDIVDQDASILVSGFNGLYFLDISDETNPVEIHSIEDTDYLTSLAYDDGSIVAASSGASSVYSYQLNKAPLSTDSSVSAIVNTLLNGLLNSQDPEGDSVAYTVDTDVTNGMLVINNDGSFDYTPNVDFIGEDSFQYTAEDEHGGFSSATVSITVETGYDHVFNATVDTMFYGQVTESGLEGKEIKFKMMVSPTNGKIIFNRNGTFQYLANPGFVGEDSFEYKASNRIDYSDNKTVKINVNPID